VKPEFHEAWIAKHSDPIDAPDQDFAWQDLIERLKEDAEGLEQTNKTLAETIRHMLEILVPVRRKQIQTRSVGMRLLALAWVLDPSYFPGSPSLRELAQRSGVTPAKLARHAGRYSRLLHWRHRGQRHAWNWRQGQRSRLG
jgi:hypothetical protein